MHPDLSIIIVNYKSWERLHPCLDSIARQTGIRLQTLVCDNHSHDGQLEAFSGQFPWVQFTDLQANGGFAWACNAGVSMAKGNWLLFLNPDTILPEDILAGLLEFAGRHPEWKLFSIRQLDEKGRDTHPHGMFLTPWTLWGPLRSVKRLLKGKTYSKKHMASGPLAYPDWLSGSFILVKKSDLAELGGWDDGYWMYCEDMDLGRKARQNGWVSILLNEWTCMHSHGGASRSSFETKALTKSEVIISTHHYMEKYFSKWGKAAGHLQWMTGNFILLLLTSLFSKLSRVMLRHLVPFWSTSIRSGLWESPRKMKEPWQKLPESVQIPQIIRKI
jgi:hypothetical protein